MKSILYILLVVLFLLHNDFWLWDDATRWLGLPVGLTFHVAYCIVTTGLMLLLVRYAWPTDLESPQ